MFDILEKAKHGGNEKITDDQGGGTGRTQRNIKVSKNHSKTMAWANSKGWPKCLGVYTCLGDQKMFPAPGFRLAKLQGCATDKLSDQGHFGVCRRHRAVEALK